jgi:hypothetical protein
LPAETPEEEEEEEARAAFSFFAWRFSFSEVLAAVFELFEPPLSLLAMVCPSKRSDREFNVSPWNERRARRIRWSENRYAEDTQDLVLQGLGGAVRIRGPPDVES